MGDEMKKTENKKNILFIGGTGTISIAITKELMARDDVELFLINRGNRNDEINEKVHFILGDINKEEDINEKIHGMQFDVVVDFIAFHKEQLERDYRLFRGRTKQFVFISSASAYQKPLNHYMITESTPLCNPYWEYSRNKIQCEEYLMELYREERFPITIVRPSHTYGDKSVPVAVHGTKGSWQVLKRMKEGKPVIIHGDGTSLWTLTHNTDFAKAFIGLLGNKKAIGEAIHITSDETLTWNQIYQLIADALGVECHPIHISSKYLADHSNYDLEGSLIGDKANSVVFDNSKIKRLVPTYLAKMPFADGVKNTIHTILNNPELQVEDLEFDEWCDRMIDNIEK